MSYNSLYSNIERFVKLGLKVDITELDIRLPEPVTEELFQLQAQMYRKLMEIMLSFESCDTFVVWGVTDALSWIPNHAKGYNDALIFDRQYQPKPAFFSLREALITGPVEL